jgi:hypothetical protein
MKDLIRHSRRPWLDYILPEVHLTTAPGKLLELQQTKTPDWVVKGSSVCTRTFRTCTPWLNSH